MTAGRQRDAAQAGHAAIAPGSPPALCASRDDDAGAEFAKT
jgi:hypothetical protein